MKFASLETLILNSNNIQNKGAQFLSNVIESNPSIHFLHLFNCKIGPAGCKDISKALRMNLNLRLLNMKKNAIEEAGINAIAESLESNTSLVQFQYDDELLNNLSSKLLNLLLKKNIAHFKKECRLLTASLFQKMSLTRPSFFDRNVISLIFQIADLSPPPSPSSSKRKYSVL